MKNLIHAFPSYSTDQIEESLHFYKEILGFEVQLKLEAFLHVQITEDTTLIIYYKANYEAAGHTVLNLQVTNIRQVVTDLSDAGIKFLQYPPPIETDAQGISWDEEGSHLAWFKDPGGNIIALIEN
ncbi:MAG: VOC family protein [Bacteroidota bacterium]